eukprot:6318733-Lingulodinium_polyedra.AAC.1
MVLLSVACDVLQYVPLLRVDRWLAIPGPRAFEDMARVKVLCCYSIVGPHRGRNAIWRMPVAIGYMIRVA